MNFLQTLRQWAASPAAEKNLQSIFGDHINWVAAYRHLDALRRGDFSLLPPIEVLEGAAMPCLWGGYSRDLRRIFLSADCTEELITPVLLEEVGHFFDQEFCAEETPGDEGALFASVVLHGSANAAEASAFESENDLHEIKFANALIPVEAAPKVRGSAKTNPQPSPKVRGKAGSKTVPDTSISQDGNVIYANKDSVRLVQTKANQRLIGSQGNDTFAVITQDVRLEDPKGGTDTVESNISFSLASFGFIERLTLTGTSAINGTGNSLNNSMTGNSGNNVLDAGAGNDTMVGGGGKDTLIGGVGNDSLFTGSGNDSLVGGAGIDTMAGGSGNDTYVGEASDLIVESINAGTDLVESAASYTLGSNLENLSLTGTSAINGTGNSLNNSMTGNSGNNVLDAGAGNDTMVGGGGNDTLIGGVGNDSLFTGSGNNSLVGGAGIDTMAGGSGNDTYVGEASDLIVESVNAGTDLVESAASYTLGSNLENLSLTGTSAINGTGNSLNNSMTGNSGNNVLDGAGGIDTLNGGSGNDTYILNDTLDTIVEAVGASAGTDTIQTTQAVFSMVGYANVENLSYSGTSLGVTFTGNSGNNTIAGTSGADSLDGASGADSLIGGAGHDTYFVDSSSDRIFENTNAGKDLVISIANTHTLGANVESLILNGSDSISGFGNDLKNSITGNNANNTLSGQGGDDYIVGDGQLPSISFTGRSVTGVGIDYLLNRTNALVADLGSPSGLSNAGTFGERTLTRGDDSSSSAIDITSIFGPNGINLYGNQVKSIFINTNGNITFGNALDIYSPLAINGGVGTAIIAPFWADVDTRSGRSNVSAGGNSTGSNLIYWDVDADNRVLTITWDDVRYFGQQTSGGNPDTKVNAFQIQLIDSGGGNAFIVFRYESIDWTTGTASGGVSGLGGQAARAGFNSGTGTIIELPQSGDDLSMLELDQRLPLAGLNSQQPGVYIFEIRNGSIVNDFGGNDSLLGGAGNDILLGNGGNDTLDGGADDDSLDGGAGVDSMVGGIGDDTYVVNNSSDNVVELNVGINNGGIDTVLTSVSYTLGNHVEILNLQGLGNISGVANSLNNTIAGNSGRNTLSGLAGDDFLDGGAEADLLDGGEGNDSLQGGAADNLADSLYGGLGNDTYVVDSDIDIISDLGGSSDLIQSSVSISLSSQNIFGIEHLHLTGPDQINGTGNTAANSILGNDAANLLDGGLGVDSLYGGAGDDTLINDVNDATLDGGTGVDLIQSASSVSLAETRIINVENLLLSGSANVNATGNSGSNLITGNSGDNSLDGGGGADTLYGNDGFDTLNGGANDGVSDYLFGGNGDDVYIINYIQSDALGDFIVDSGGNDRVVSSVYFDINDQKVSGIENLTYTGSSAITLTGNSVNNSLISEGAGNDTLIGLAGDDYLDGGSGVNSLIGGSGNDTMFAGLNDTLNGGDDTDWVSSATSVSLAESRFSNMENLILTGTAVSGAGNAAANTIVGNNNANSLDGGAGEDQFLGGAGNDTLIVDASDTSVDGGSDTDWVVSATTVDFTEARFLNVENILLEVATAISATGNVVANSIIGNSLANTLRGGAGSDTIAGSGGADSISGDDGDDLFLFTDSLGASTINGGADTDTLRISSSSTITLVDNDFGNISNVESIDLVAPSLNVTIGLIAQLAGIISYSGKEGNDTLTASDYSVGISLDGAGGNDSITGGKADDTISGGSGSNTLVGGSGDDLIILSGLTSSIVGGAGLDTVQFADAGVTIQDADLAKFNTVEILQATAGTNNFVLGANATLAGIQTIFGADGNDSIDASALGTAYGISLVGGNGKNTLVGGGSNDSLTGGTGNDTISGNAGDDTIIGGGGADNLSGGAGYDTFIFTTNNLATTRVDGGASDTLGYDTILFTQAAVTIGDAAFSNVTSVERLQLGSGNNSVSVGPNATLAGLKKIEGGVGVNTLSASGYDSLSSITLNASASTAASLVGGEGADILQGGAGADTLDGGGGADAMNGGAASDIYYLRQTTDSIAEFAADGTADRVLSWLDYTAINFVEIVELQGIANLTAIGNFFEDRLDTRFDTLIGNSGNNVLDDGKPVLFFHLHTPFGSIMQGGDGDDTYIVHSQFTEIKDTQGNDAVETFVSYTLPGGSVKKITLVNGAADALAATGSGQAETLIGNNLANTLDGGGGADTMVGGLGGDTYVVDNSGDILTEAVNQGIDVAQIRSGGDLTNGGTFVTSYILADGNNVENLHYISQTGTAFLTGNELDNSMLGGRANDTLRGGAFGNDTLNGAGGDDYMAGGYGNDYYQVDSASDVVVEQSNAGTDTVDSEVSYTLAGGVENLILSGSGNLDGTGNIDANTITGNNQNNRLDGLFGADSLCGLAGDDVYIVDNIGDILDERDALGFDAGGVDIVFSSVTFDLLTNSPGSLFVENLVLTGSANINGTGNSDGGNPLLGRPDNNSLTGNAGNNTLTGGFGDDTIDGGSGVDTLIGGAGNDVYVIDDNIDVIEEAINEGTDTVYSSTTHSLAVNVENLTLTGSSIINGTGNDANNLIIGNGAVNNLIGIAGDDTLDGANGADILTGGIGNDVYVIDNTGDTATELLGEGTADTVRSSVAITTLFANIENLIHTGLADLSSSGNDLDNIMTGNEGVDTLRGGLGNDTYVLNNTVDTAIEVFGQGTNDEVQSTVTYTLSDNIEILRLIGVADIDAFGTGSDNTLYGNIGNNSMGGNVGNDLMIGGAGNDTYVVEAALDVVNEFSNQGTDTVESSITYTLGSDLENLILSGTANLNGTGNTLANAITGNSGNNILDGGIGTNGVDTLTGNSGNDTFVLANAAGSYYNSSGDLDYAVITDFSAGDQLQLRTGITYTAGSLDGTAAQSWHAQSFSGLFANSDLVAVIKSDVVVGAQAGAIYV